MRKTMLLKIISCVLFLSLMLYPSNPTAYYSKGNVFYGLFTEPVEVSYVIFWDGNMLKFTSYEDNRIDLLYDGFKEIVEEEGYEIGDIAIKIHNHLPGGGFHLSDGDLKFMRSMRRDGFEGSYCIQTPGRGIRCRREEDLALIQLLREKGTKEFLKKYKKEYPEAYGELIDFMTKRALK